VVRDRQPPDPPKRDGDRPARPAGPASSRPNKPGKHGDQGKKAKPGADSRGQGANAKRNDKGGKGRADKRDQHAAGKPTKNMGFRGPLEQPPPPAWVAKPEQREPIRQVVEIAVMDAGLDLVELEIKQAGADWRIGVSIDRLPGRGGITLEECARASRRIAGDLDAIEGMAEIYELEVGSPGMNRRLRGVADLHRYEGLTVKATIAPPQRESVIGVLIGVEGAEADPLLTLRIGKAQPKKGITGKVQLQWSDLEAVHLWPTLPEWRDLGLKLAEEARAAGLPYAGGEDHNATTEGADEADPANAEDDQLEFDGDDEDLDEESADGDEFDDEDEDEDELAGEDEDDAE
jgi:ribosome maturation factor RimP